MQVLAINGQDVSHASREQATEALRCTGDYIALLVRSNLQAYAAFRRRLLRESRDQAATLKVRAFGVSRLFCSAIQQLFWSAVLTLTQNLLLIFQDRLREIGGSDVRVVQLSRDRDGFGLAVEKDDRIGVLMITRVVPNSAAARTGQIRTGMELCSEAAFTRHFQSWLLQSPTSTISCLFFR